MGTVAVVTGRKTQTLLCANTLIVSRRAREFIGEVKDNGNVNIIYYLSDFTLSIFLLLSPQVKVMPKVDAEQKGETKKSHRERLCKMTSFRIFNEQTKEKNVW